jgi:hypothetical protein
VLPGSRTIAKGVEVIGSSGEKLGVMLPAEGLRLARETSVDLVEVNPKTNPPVCELFDFQRFKYVVYDVRTIPPGATEKTDAIAVRLDHQAGYSVVVMIPYRLADGQLVKGTVFAVKGDASIFPPLQ